ncbi:MAG TPA: right-handed parallel beta-helix repeat-containing protein [Verrucomicrobiae bacterium]|nr:right-handed parallel beta-helix repeat-containing protein [Verrucomicrobiae bacterium]
MKKIHFSTGLVCLALLAASGSSGREFYVSLQGKATAAGTVQDPLDSIQVALDRAQAGDAVIIRGGRYPLKREIQVAHSGIPEHWLTIQAYEQENVQIDGGQLTDENPQFSDLGTFNLKGVQYVRVKDLGVINSHNLGFMVRGPQTRHIELIGCRSDKSYNSGIGIWYAEQVNVLRCEVTGANDQDLRTPRQRLEHEAPHEAISLAGAQYFDVASNEVHHCLKEGIDCKEVSAHGRVHHNFVHDMPRQGLYADAWFGLLEDVEFDSNTVTRCEWGAGISVEGTGAEMNNVRFHHNILFKNRASGILFGVWGTNGLRRNIAIYNNTIYGNGTKKHWAGSTGGIDVRSANISHVRIFNNICSQNYAFAIATFAPPAEAQTLLKGKDVVIENNWLDSGEPIDEGGGVFNRTYPYAGKSHFDGNPMFVDPAHGDFRLQNGSPAVGKGETVPEIGGGKNLGAL